MGVELIQRIVEAYIGEYAAGKSENALNRAARLAQQGRQPQPAQQAGMARQNRQVTLVDLDLVEPFYTLRPLQEELRQMGVTVIASKTEEVMGLGEAGSVLKPEMQWVLKRPGDIILDIGYGVEGAKTLNLVQGAFEDPDLRVFAVINASRPMTFTVPDIVEHVRGMGLVHGLINNTHLGDETTTDVVEAGAETVAAAARIVGLPVTATSIDEHLAPAFPNGVDHLGHPVRLLHRMMSRAFW